MFKRDDDGYGALVGIGIVLAIVAFIIYITVLLISVIAMVAVGIGVVIGGGTAIINYALSFKENIIDANKKVAGTAA